MPSPLRAPAAPAQDAARRPSFHKPAAHQPAAHQPAAHQPSGLHRRSNPALLSATGSSGFDANTRPSGPKITLPTAPGAPEAVRSGKPGTVDNAGATTGTAQVGSVGGGAVDAVFKQGSKVYESILDSLGFKDLPEIEDPTARLQQRSDYLGKVLTDDPTLKEKISRSDLMQAWHVSQIFASPDFQAQLNEAQKQAVGSYQHTFGLMRSTSDWPPPPER